MSTDARSTGAVFELEGAGYRYPGARRAAVAAMIDDGNIPGKGPSDAAEYLYRALRTGAEDVYNLLTSEPTMFKVETRKALQQKLSQFAFYEGGIDGDFGPGTQRGIRAAYGLNE